MSFKTNVIVGLYYFRETQHRDQGKPGKRGIFSKSHGKLEKSENSKRNWKVREKSENFNL